MVWFCEFRGGINDWDLKILYRDLKSWKKRLKKNGMEWFGGLEKLKKWNGWNGWGKQMVNTNNNDDRSCTSENYYKLS